MFDDEPDGFYKFDMPTEWKDQWPPILFLFVLIVLIAGLDALISYLRFL